jgi:hypothetical protein
MSDDLIKTEVALRRAMAKRGIDGSGVDFTKLAEQQVDNARRVAGWEAPRILLPEWRELDRGDDGARYLNAQRRLMAILSCSMERDGRAWLHLSVSRTAKDRLPSHGEMRICKEAFLGDREAYAVWPPKARYVNLVEVLHLFALLDETAAALPDFTGGTGSI